MTPALKPCCLIKILADSSSSDILRSAMGTPSRKHPLPRQSHDQRFKTLFRACLPELLDLVCPAQARRLDCGQAQFLDKETFTDVVGGKQQQMDLVAMMPEQGHGRRLVVVLTEVEERGRRAGRLPFPERMARYLATLWLRHQLPVLPVLVSFAGRHQGLEHDRFTL